MTYDLDGTYRLTASPNDPETCAGYGGLTPYGVREMTLTIAADWEASAVMVRDDGSSFDCEGSLDGSTLYMECTYDVVDVGAGSHSLELTFNSPYQMAGTDVQGHPSAAGGMCTETWAVSGQRIE